MAEVQSTQPADVEYRELADFPGYSVGSDGSVWSARTGRWRKLKGTTNHHGYLVVSPCVRGVNVNRFVHVLVLTAFQGPCPEGHECAHGPGGKLDNSIGNIRWATRAENHLDRESDGTVWRGDTHPLSKLTTARVREIRELVESGLTHKAVAGRFGVKRATVGDIITKRRWASV